MRRAALLPLVLLGAAACGEEYTHLRFDRLTQPPLPMQSSRRHLQLHEGTAVAVKAVAMDGGDEMEDPPQVELWPCDPWLVGVAPALEERSWSESLDEEDDRPPEEKAPAFVIWGAGAGRSCLRVVLDGRERESIGVDVIRPRQ